MNESPLVIGPRGRDAAKSVPVVAAAVLVLVGFGILGSPVAAAVGLVPVAILVLGGPLLSFAGGTLAVVGTAALVGLSPLPAVVLLASLPLAATHREYGWRVAALYLATIAAAVGLFVLSQSAVSSLTSATAIVVLNLCLISYGIHRYELLSLGLIDE
jgi:hypothetical protein